MPHDKEPFVGTVMICNDCKGEFFSKYQGEFVRCPCGKCFIDETRYYARVSGNCKPKEETDASE